MNDPAANGSNPPDPNPEQAPAQPGSAAPPAGEQGPPPTPGKGEPPTEPAAPADPLAALRKELEKTQAESRDWKNQYARALADYDNLRKRTAKEVLEASSRGKEHFAKVLLPVLDTFHSAIRQMTDAKVDKKVMEGIEMLWFQFSDTLEKEGLKAIPAMHQKFNPEEHEAMMRSSNPELDDDIIVKEFETGYKFKERVIRTAKVEINQK